MQWYLYDERDGQEAICQHCNKIINKTGNKKATSKYYILQAEYGNESTNIIIGAGCVKEFTGQTIQAIKQATNEMIAAQCRL